MTTSTLRLALVSGLGLATLLVAPRSTLADYNDNNFGPENGWVTTVETIPLSLGLINSCDVPQQQIDFSATATLTTKTLTTSGNFTYIKSKQEISGYGTGRTDGATYLFADLQTYRAKTHSIPPVFPFNFIFHETVLLNGQGVVPSQTIDIYYNLLINANGTAVHDIAQVSLRCS
jgi:hypothetical protein